MLGWRVNEAMADPCFVLGADISQLLYTGV
ncbi:hypothetical protein V474_15670 [Novosphingobium barchaimii LL02]|uniref:Uncharacterized protein n=1 Tax=Novosphingobium barchaimii LL02 TaxID=1114963 RepID=A0A0J7XZQ0_9SPHN|nr:hypothetical protein V474_15670 [Novosphingobium barchaimii LL02]